MLTLAGMLRFDQEVALVSMYLPLHVPRELLIDSCHCYSQLHPSPWNTMKVAYMFCRYYPLAIAPFHLWGILGNHDQRVCESYYLALYACAMPTVRSFLRPV